MLLETLPEVQALAPADKWVLMRELWQDLNPQIADAERDQQIFEILQKRTAEYLADPSLARPQAEVMARLDRRKEARREESKGIPASWEADLAQMASDPEIIAELRRIDSEFRVTEMDGLKSA
jgi:hypothetical protein